MLILTDNSHPYKMTTKLEFQNKEGKTLIEQYNDF